jgi:DNA-binding transcriptional MerR regulator
MQANGPASAAPSRPLGKSATAFRTIAEAAQELDVPQHVLRFWETRFSQIKPLKRRGGRRYYRPEDIELLAQVRGLLYRDGYTIKGVQKLLREGGVKRLPSVGSPALLPAAASERPVSDVRGALTDILAELDAIRDLLRRGR